MKTIKIAISGCEGRMGKAVEKIVIADVETDLAGKFDVDCDTSEALSSADVIIDFTTHGFTPELLAACINTDKRLVIGTTGHTAAEIEEIKSAAEIIPIVFAPNFSVGVNTLFYLADKAARILGDSFDLEVIEMHHRHKTDSPSGTAKKLAQVLSKARGLDYNRDGRHGRVGDVGARTKNEIGIHALRGGDVVGDHTAVFAADGERLELTHRASGRETFAAGAVRAGKWLMQQEKGLYDMQDVLGLK